MKHLIITISRQYGSGGRIIGELVAKELGIQFYNRNLIDMIAHESGLDSGYIENWERQVNSPIIWGFSGAVPRMRGYVSQSMQKAYYSNEDKMFAAQSKIIQQIAQEGSCVIVGRCADYILRDYAKILNVMIYADESSRVFRLYNEYGERTGDICKLLATVDRGRANYYRRHTDRSWGVRQNYNLMLDSGYLGIETCVALVVSAAKAKAKEIV